VFTSEVLEESRGATHVNMSTVSMETARALARDHDRAGVDYVSAPVLGRPNLAQSGQLNIVAAGAGSALDRAEPLLLHLGKRVWRVGDEPEKANLVKIGVNYNLIHAMQALAESVGLLESGDVDGATFVEILTDAAFTGSAYGGYGPMIAQRAYTPTMFSMELGLKDLRLVASAAEEVGSALPTVDVLTSIFEEALDDAELAELDWSAMAEVTRRRVR
jgi:3-hydroxyisobutyrate dehydrogenase-like beta-hydroxyacid dehydrogenase